jgi:hypothetical protein
MGLVTIGGYNYSLRLPALAQRTHPLRCWLLAMQPPRPAPRILPEGWERTSQRLARIPLPPLLRWVHPHPQVKSVDFLQSTQLVVNLVRLPNQMYYSGKIFTYRLDRTTVTVGAPRMLATSTSPASAGASSCASVAACSSKAVVVGSVLPSTTGGWRVSYATSSSTVGAGLRLPPLGSPTVSQSPSPPCFTGSEGGISCKQWRFIVSTLH